MSKTAPSASPPSQTDYLVSRAAAVVTAALLTVALFTCNAHPPRPHVDASIASPRMALLIPSATEKPPAPSWRPSIPSTPTPPGSPPPVVSRPTYAPSVRPSIAVPADRPSIPPTPAPPVRTASPSPPRPTPPDDSEASPRQSQIAARKECYRTQKLIVEAIEQYKLDKSAIVTSLHPSVMVRLKSGGYLRSLPDDPGTGPDTSNHYRFARDDHFYITCSIHGSMHGRPGERREPTPDAELRADFGRFVDRVLIRVAETDRPVAVWFKRFFGVAGKPWSANDLMTNDLMVRHAGPSGFKKRLDHDAVCFVNEVMEPAYLSACIRAGSFQTTTPEVCALAAMYARVRDETRADCHRLSRALFSQDRQAKIPEIVRSLQERKTSPLGTAFHQRLQELATRTGVMAPEPSWR